MEEPKISWLVRRDEDKSFQKNPDFYTGTYNQKKPLQLYLQIWNNRFGSENVKDFEDISITISFDKEEDTVLLKYMTFILGMTTFTPVVNGDTAVIKLPESVVLSGMGNDGSDENSDNYVVVQLVIDIPDNVNLKMNDLKTMTLNVEKF